MQLPLRLTGEWPVRGGVMRWMPYREALDLTVRAPVGGADLRRVDFHREGGAVALVFLPGSAMIVLPLQEVTFGEIIEADAAPTGPLRASAGLPRLTLNLAVPFCVFMEMIALAALDESEMTPRGASAPREGRCEARQKEATVTNQQEHPTRMAQERAALLENLRAMPDSELRETLEAFALESHRLRIMQAAVSERLDEAWGLVEVEPSATAG